MAYMTAGSDQVFGGNFQPAGASQGWNPAAKKLTQMGYQQPGQQQVTQKSTVTQPQANVTKAPDMSAYSPGQAQPQQQRSQGTSYGSPPTGGGYPMPEPETGGGFQMPQQQTQYGGSQLMTQLQQQYGQPQGYPMPQQGRPAAGQQAPSGWMTKGDIRSQVSSGGQPTPQQYGGSDGTGGGFPIPQQQYATPGSQYRPNSQPVATDYGQAGGLMADPEETRRYDEIMASNGVSRQDYADPRYQDYLRRNPGTANPDGDIVNFGRYKQSQQQSQQPFNDRPMPGQGGIPQDFRGAPGTYAMPPQFQTQMTDMFGNPTSPDQYFPQQDAFVAQLINRLGQNQGGTYLGQGAPPADWGRPQPFDINNLWGNAGDMIQGGWQNPFAAPIEANPYFQPIRDPDAAQPLPQRGRPFMTPDGPYAWDFAGFRDWQQPFNGNQPALQPGLRY